MKIFFNEDDRIIREFYVKRFKKEGYKIVDGIKEEADIALIDINNGIGAVSLDEIKNIRAKKKVCFSNYPRSYIYHLYPEFKFDDFILKISTNPDTIVEYISGLK